VLDDRREVSVPTGDAMPEPREGRQRADGAGESIPDQPQVELDHGRIWDRIRQALEDLPAEATRTPEDARVGAVLALFEEADEGSRIVFTRRRRDMRSHPGQLSFPGGRVDPPETAEEAALREAREEIALRPETVEVAGRGPTFFIPPSKFWVVPIVGRWSDPHPLDPNPWEVDEILHVPVTSLLEPGRWRYVPLSTREAMWAWQLDDDILWGATAVMVTALLHTVAPGWNAGLEPLDLGEQREVRPWEDIPLPTPRARLPDVPSVPLDEVPVVASRQAAELDRILRRDLRVELVQLFEHGGRGVADAVRRLAGDDVTGVPVTVLTGPGGNGAVGMAAARLLAAAGADVEVLTATPPRSADQVEGLTAIDVPVRRLEPDVARPGEVVIDAMLGVGCRPPVEGGVAAAIEWLRRHDVPVVAVDLPSGVHPDEGLRGPCVTADVTVTLGAPKPALLTRLVQPYAGDLYLADLGVPRRAWRRLEVEPVDVFGRGPLVRLVRDEGDAAAPPQGEGG
jgi:hydroxyethylthiazole kinase-like uncharacterized protein yjeF